MKKITAMIFILMLMYSCEHDKVDLYKFCGGKIYLKGKTLWEKGGGYNLHIKHNGKYSKVFVYKIDWEAYKRGDTIVCRNKELKIKYSKEENKIDN